MEETIAEAERLGDEAILAEALRRFGVLSMWIGDNDRSEQLLRRSLEHARSVGNSQLTSSAAYWIGLVLLWGSTPVDAALEESRRLILEVDRMARSELLVVQGALLALTGDFEQGRELAAEGRRGLLDLGQSVQHAAIAQPVAIIELLADDDAEAERLLREAHELLLPAGERGYLSTISALLALALARQERYAEAGEFADESRRMGAEDDLITQVYWRVAKAQAVAAEGQADEAARLAAEAIELVPHDGSFDAPMAILELAEFLPSAETRPALERALAGATAKGNTVIAAKARARLAALP
jgi:tetratricopeptide (TPR) repeat protein